MVGAANHEDTVVVLQPINLIQEVASDVVGDYRIEIFEDEITRGELSCSVEYLFD